jgi:outer membrane protein
VKEKTSMPRLTRLLMIAGLTLCASKALAEDLKIGYVDLQRAIAETEDGRKAKAQLKKEFDQKQKELNEQQDDVRKGAEDLEKKRTLLPAEKVREKEAELQAKMQKIQQTYLRHQQDLSEKEQALLGKITERMYRIINKISISENFSMVLDKGAVAFAKPYLDLTNELIRRYNSGEGAEPGGGPAGKAPAAAAGGAAGGTKPKK